MTELHPQRITIRGKAAHTFDRLPATGAKAPDFFLPDSGYRDWSLEDFAGRNAILNVVPTLESEASRDSARKLVEALAGRRGAVALTISADLPAALARWCIFWRPLSRQMSMAPWQPRCFTRASSPSRN